MTQSLMVTPVRGATNIPNELVIISPMAALSRWGKLRATNLQGSPVARYYLEEENGAKADDVIINLTTGFIFSIHLRVFSSQGDT